jgi:RNA polymerase sigma-70 factor (ECF subfamily)
MSTATDRELMVSVQRGDVARLGELFERHHRRLYHTFVRLIGDRAASEDLVQEVFVRILRYRDTFRSDAEFTPWMFTLARNVAHDHRQSRKRLRLVDAEPTAGLEGAYRAPETADGEPTPPTRLEDEQTRRRLERALASLSPDRREALALARFAELPYEEIGAIVGATTGAVKVRVHRALNDLRSAYLDIERNEHVREARGNRHDV